MRLTFSILPILACVAIGGNQAEARSMLVVLDELEVIEGAGEDADPSNPPANTEPSGLLGQPSDSTQGESGSGGSSSSSAAGSQGGPAQGGAGSGGGGGGGGGAPGSGGNGPATPEGDKYDGPAIPLEQLPPDLDGPIEFEEPDTGADSPDYEEGDIPADDWAPLKEEGTGRIPTPDPWGEQARPLSLAVGPANAPSGYGQMPEATSLTIFGLLGAAGLALRPRFRRDED